ncbi:MAG: acyl-CoA thioester hydrolase/BAAT C-terminal domain-containing protein [Clostridiales bacterium]
MSLDIDLKKEGFMGTLFTPKTKTDKAIIVVTGSDGGIENAKTIAKLLAENGFFALAVGYWYVKGLSYKLSNIPIEYIENAVNWLKKYQNGTIKKIGMYGWSKGTELTLTSATLFPDITCVVGVTPSCYIYEGVTWYKFPIRTSSWSYKNRPLPYFHMKGCAGWNFIKRVWKGRKLLMLYRYDELFTHPIPEEAIIPVEKIHGNVLVLSTTTDDMWPSEYGAKHIVDRLKANNFPYEYKHVNFDIASHYLTPVTAWARTQKNERKFPELCAKARKDAFDLTVDWFNKW